MKKSLLQKHTKTINSRSFRASFQHRKKIHAASYQSSGCNGKRELFKRRNLNEDSAEERTRSIDLQLSLNLRDTSIPKETKEDDNIETFAEKCNEVEQESKPHVDASSGFVLPTKDARENIIPASSKQSTISKLLKVELENAERKEKLRCAVTDVFSQQGQVPDLGRVDNTTLKIMKKIRKKVHKLNKKQKEERVNLYKTCDEEMEQLENVHRVESALYRILYEDMPMKAHKLKLLSEKHSKKLDELKRKASENLEDLCAKQLDLRNNEEELNARRLKKWKGTEFKLQGSYRDCVPARVVDTVPDELAVSQEVQPDRSGISACESAASSFFTPINSPSRPPVSDPGDGLQLPLHKASNSQCAHIPEPTGVQDHAAVIIATNSPWQETKPSCSDLTLSFDKLNPGASTAKHVDVPHVSVTPDTSAGEMLNSQAVEERDRVPCADNVQKLQALSTNLHSGEDQPHPPSARENHQPSSDSIRAPAELNIPKPLLVDPHQSEMDRTDAMMNVLSVREVEDSLKVEVLPLHIDNSKLFDPSHSGASVGEKVTRATNQDSVPEGPISHVAHKHHQPSHGRSISCAASDVPLPSNSNLPESELEREHVMEEQTHNKHVDVFQAPGESPQISKCSGVADVAATVAGNNGPLQTKASHLGPLSEKLYLEAPTEELVISSDVSATIDTPASKMPTTPAEEVPETCEDNVAELRLLSTNLYLPEGQPHPQSSHEIHHVEAPTEEPLASSHIPAPMDSPASEMLNTRADEALKSCVDNVDVLPSLSTNLCLPEDQSRPQSARESYQPSLDSPVTHAASLTASPLIDLIQTEVDRTSTVRYTLPAREGQSALGVEVLASHIDNAVPTYQYNTDASVGEPVVRAALPIFTVQHFASAQYHPSSHSPHGHHQASHRWSAPHEASHAPMSSNPDPLVSELERILIVKEQTDKTHANTKVHLKSECLKEMTQIYKKYQVKLQEAEAGFLSKKEKLEEYIYKLNMNKLLAEALQTKFMSPVPSGQPVRQQAFSNIPQEQQLFRPSSSETVRRLPAALPVHMTSYGPNSTSIQAFPIEALLSSVARLSVAPVTPTQLRPFFPANPSSLSQQEARPRAVFPVAPPLQRVHDSSELFSATPAGNSTPIYSPALSIQSVSGIRGPAPHLRRRNSSMPQTVALQPWLSNQQC